MTLGCGRNEVDSDQLAGLFHREGAAVVEDPALADVVLVNTCTFIAPAKRESIDTVLEACQLKDDAAAQAVLVVGCMAQRYPQELAEAIPEADAVVGFDGYARLPTIVEDVLAGRGDQRVVGVGPPDPGSRPRRDLPQLSLTPVATAPATPMATSTSRSVDAGVLELTVRERDGEVPAAEAAANDDGSAPQDQLDRMPASGPRFPVRVHDGRPWAYLKIASGCDRVCTFCAIPSFRGRFRSRPLDEVLAEAAWLADNGARELVLVSENTTSWGKDLPGGRRRQPELLRELSEVEGIDRIRLMYLQPAEVTAPLLESIAELPKVASYFDLSLQHVAAPIVAAMARSGDAGRFSELIGRIRELDPHAVFRSNFILGFPGETEAHVDELESFLAEHVLDWVGLFPFSVEDGTPSAQLGDQVPAEHARERLARDADLQERLADEAARAFVGRELEVTVQTIDEEGGVPATIARSYREAPDTDGEIRLLDRAGRPIEVPVGRTLRAEVTEAVGVDLRARPRDVDLLARPRDV